MPGGIGTSTAATYRVFHGGTFDEVVIDQTTAEGFVSLGEFELAADGTEYVELGDNTGTKGDTLAFDAIRVTAVDGGGNGNSHETGCCGAGGGPG